MTRDHRQLLLRLVLALVVAVLLMSCESLSYYTQAARGQLAILLGREAIEELLAQNDLSPQLREKFSTVLAIREFAATELHLPVGDNYLTYVDLDRDHVVWNVFAAPEFSIDPVNWCYPVAGCVSYRGYFTEAGALRFAQRLQARNYDVYTAGVDAYSTLGWFDDSLLSTVSRRSDYQLAALIFHELAHQVTYVPGDTTFNESFATAVEREGLRRWLAARQQHALLVQADTERTRQEQFVALVARYREQLDALYREELEEAGKRQRKAQLQEALRLEYTTLKQAWEGYAGYDNWFAGELNNAQLSTVSSYNDLVPFFQQLLASVQGDLTAFYAEVKRIGALETDARHQLTSAVTAE